MTTPVISLPWQNGHDAGLNGPNQNNCHFSNFATPADRDEWERGNKIGKDLALARQFAIIKLQKFMKQRRSEFLLSLDEFKALSARDQGICAYLQGLWKGCQISSENPFVKDSDHWKDFQEGEHLARKLATGVL
jgi:hypothetical protein